MATIYDGLFIQNIVKLNETNDGYIRRKLQPFIDEYVDLIRNGLEYKPRSFEKEQIKLLLMRQSFLNDEKMIKLDQVTRTGSIIDVEIENLNNQKIAIILLN
ncbi:hypothetical protein BLA29_008742, partial [Euroglyphus maynei]